MTMKRTRHLLLTMLGIAAIVAGVALLVSVVGAVSHDDRVPRLDAAAIGAPVSDAPKTLATSEQRELAGSRLGDEWRVCLRSLR
jgi:hypothetical protein